MATIDLWQDFVRAPSDESFRPLYEATKRLVWTLAIRILRDPNDATDAFQGAYSRLVALARDERAAAAIVDDDDLARLVARATVREADRIRKRRARRKARERLVGASGAMDHEGRSSRLGRRGGESPIEASAASEIREKVERIVSALPERYRLPILLHYFDGLPLRKVAEALDVPLATLAHRHRRALERLEMPLRHAGLDGTRALATIALGALLIEPRISAASVFTAANAAASVGPALTSAL
ncbi:MAG TPA: sigma-70 family RNA polymerase sigma factor, partial [Planctomycetota bacterium]|nr:sigma-70 family RNA polymerase sigma factor [Planctomycetota bacterium]